MNYIVRDISNYRFNACVTDYINIYCDLIGYILTEGRFERELPKFEVIYCGCGEADLQEVSKIYKIIDKALSKCRDIEIEARLTLR